MLTALLGNSLVIFVVLAFVAALCIATYIGVPRVFPRETQLYGPLLLRSPIYIYILPTPASHYHHYQPILRVLL